VLTPAYRRHAIYRRQLQMLYTVHRDKYNNLMNLKIVPRVPNTGDFNIFNQNMECFSINFYLYLGQEQKHSLELVIYLFTAPTCVADADVWTS